MFSTANQGLAAVFMMNGHEPVRAFRDDRDKAALEFEKTPGLMRLFASWRAKEVTGNLAEFNDMMFEVRGRLREVA